MSDIQGGDQWFCTSCGAAGIPGNRFCSACGAARTSTPPTQSIPSPPPGQIPPQFATPAAPPQPPSKSNRSTFLIVGGIAAVIVLLIAGLVIGKSMSSDKKETASPSTSSTQSSTTVAPTTTMPATTTTAPPTPTELNGDFPYDPNKCGVDASPKSYAHSTSRTYEVTATIGLWSSPTTNSNLLKTIPVTTYGPGGIGCPDFAGPWVTIFCQITNGQNINGPFGNDPVWLRTNYEGTTGYVPDQWVDTEWDTGTIPRC